MGNLNLTFKSKEVDVMKIKIQILLVVFVLPAVYTSQVYANVNDHVLHIEMSMSYKFGTTSMIPTEYCFDA